MNRLVIVLIRCCLEVSQLDDLVDCSTESVDVLTASLSEVGLTTATALDEFGGFTNHLTCVEVVV